MDANRKGATVEMRAQRAPAGKVTGFVPLDDPYWDITALNTHSVALGVF